MTESPDTAPHPVIPPDDPRRTLAVARPDEDQSSRTWVWWATPTRSC
jgi:hypothetical protein